MAKKNIFLGARVKVFDPRLYENDITTPLTHTMRAATVIRRYVNKYPARAHGNVGVESDDCCDVRFDHDGRESKGHFTYGIELIANG